MFNGERINCIEDGKIDKQPDGFFDIIENQLGIILGF